MLGTIVGSYRITDKIAVGGMGTVYRAEHTLIGRVAALKVLHPEMTQSADIVQRFFNEAKATSTIKHPGIVEVFDFGHMPSGHAFLVMEFLEGQTLSQRIRQRGKVPEGEAAMLMRGVCSALAAAHAKGIVHRDLKPDNIFIVPEPESALGERTKILDFGIAKLTAVGLATSATKTGAVMGTPTYMSPEQCRGTGEVDHRADLYSIGCMLYELVVGQPPFTSTGAGELLGCHLFVEPEPPSRHGPISAELENLIMNLLQKKPETRVQTATELGRLLVGVAQSQGWIAVTNTDPNARYSMQHISPPAGPVPAPLFTPMGMTPSHLTPGVVQFTPGPAHVRTPVHHAQTVFAPEVTQKPTTLSGSASQSHPVPTSRRGLTIAAGALLLATAVGIAFVVGTSKGETVQPASTGAVTAPSIAPVEMKPEPTPDPLPVKPVEVVPPPEVKPDEVKPEPVVQPPDVKPPDAKKPDAKKPGAKKPDAKRPDAKKPDTKKPDGKKPDKGEDLLETDL